MYSFFRHMALEMEMVADYLQAYGNQVLCKDTYDRHICNPTDLIAEVGAQILYAL